MILVVKTDKFSRVMIVMGEPTFQSEGPIPLCPHRQSLKNVGGIDAICIHIRNKLNWFNC